MNIRTQQLSAEGTELRIYHSNYYRAVRLIGQTVVLYRPRHEDANGYYGTARLIGVEYDRTNPKWVWVALSNIIPFSQVVSLDQLYGATFTNDTPFHLYSKALRPISSYELERLQEVQEHVRFAGLSEERPGKALLAPTPKWASRKTRIRRKLLRDELIRLYGPACALTEKIYSTLSGRFFETQTSHMVALRYLGPDVIQNTLPMCSIANWHWDNGLVSLTNGGLILLSARAPPHARELFEGGRQVRFANSRVWPKAEYLEWHRDNIFEKGHQAGLVWQDSRPAEGY